MLLRYCHFHSTWHLFTQGKEAHIRASTVVAVVQAQRQQMPYGILSVWFEVKPLSTQHSWQVSLIRDGGSGRVTAKLVQARDAVQYADIHEALHRGCRLGSFLQCWRRILRPIKTRWPIEWAERDRAGHQSFDQRHQRTLVNGWSLAKMRSKDRWEPPSIVRNLRSSNPSTLKQIWMILVSHSSNKRGRMSNCPARYMALKLVYWWHSP